MLIDILKVVGILLLYEFCRGWFARRLAAVPSHESEHLLSDHDKSWW